MARYRTYKNGITGHRYKGYYIIRGESKGKFYILNDNKEIIQDNIYDYDDCEWFIDKITCSSVEIKLITMLYKKEIYQLSSLLVDLIQEKERHNLAPDKEKLYYWVDKIRRRKAEEREF